jgi:hypothetical protein
VTMAAWRAGRCSLAATALCCSLSSSAAAGDAGTNPSGRVHLALRTGYGLPFGKYANARTLATVRFDDVNSISDDTYGVVPLWIDAGYWLTQNLMLGGYFMYGLVFPKTAPANDVLSGGCPASFDCAATGVRAGIQAQYAFSAGDSVRPWVGLGLGVEWVSTHVEGGTGLLALDLETSNFGPELIHLQGGADYILHPSFALGPFASLSALRYTSCATKLSGEEQPCEINEGAWHGWLAFGLRGAFDL